MDLLLFLVFAFIAVGCGISVVLQTHPVSSALSLVGVMAALAILYLLLGAEFIAAVQIIVYAGAIMVLFLFVIMLLNAGAEKRSDAARFAQTAGVPLLVVAFTLLSFLWLTLYPTGQKVAFGAFQGGKPYDVGLALFTKYLLPFEITSILVLVALAGAIVLARKELD
jgi:NADH-quinone oxidoreductase subunit J